MERDLSHGHMARAAAGGMPAAWNGSAVVTRAAHSAGATSRPGVGRMRPPTQAPRRSRGSECQRVVLWWGVAAEVATWSPSSHGTLVAFPSHSNGRSPIAGGSPLDRRRGRCPGARAAFDRTTFACLPTGPRVKEPFHPLLSLSHGTLGLGTSERFAPLFFLKSRRASARGATLLTDNLCRTLCRAWLHQRVRGLLKPSTALVLNQKGPADADTRSGKHR